MASRKKEKTDEEIMMERLKLEIAEELGLLDKINRGGWGELNGVESGRVGGILASRLKKGLKNRLVGGAVLQTAEYRIQKSESK